jgi:hypothetical protein
VALSGAFAPLPCVSRPSLVDVVGDQKLNVGAVFFGVVFRHGAGVRLAALNRDCDAGGEKIVNDVGNLVVALGV